MRNLWLARCSRASFVPRHRKEQQRVPHFLLGFGVGTVEWPARPGIWVSILCVHPPRGALLLASFTPCGESCCTYLRWASWW